MDLIKVANLAVRFRLEVSALIALGTWGYSVGGGWAAQVGLAVGVPVATAVIWGAFVSPRAAVTVPGTVHILLQFLIFGAAAVALVQLGHRLPAGVFGLVAVANAA